MSEWISVDDRLPEYGDKILVHLDYGDIKGILLEEYSGTKFWSRAFNNVTHWMPLPEPPE